jgi:hypothetical protein
MAQRWRKLRKLVDVRVKLGGHELPPGDVKLSGDYWAQFSPQFLEPDPTPERVIVNAVPVVKAPPVVATPKAVAPVPHAAPVIHAASVVPSPEMPLPPSVPAAVQPPAAGDFTPPSDDAGGSHVGSPKGKRKKF